MQAFGEKAVDAIKNYETVAETLDKSVTMALQANRTVALVMDMLRGVSVTNLERQANASLAESKALLVNVLRQQVTIDGKSLYSQYHLRFYHKLYHNKATQRPVKGAFILQLLTSLGIW